MLQMISRRLFLGIITVFLVSVIIFTGVEILPGDACTAFLERDAHGKLLENCRIEQGLNAPAISRYVDWVSGALVGDLGTTLNGQKKIIDLVGFRLRNTLLLASMATLIGVPLALFLGVVAALWRDRAADLTISTFTIGAMSIPEFVLATLLILVFSIWLGWIPGIVLTSYDAPLGEFFPAIFLPVIVLTLVMTAHILRTVRSSVIEAMASDYAQMATLKGVPYWRIVFRHVLPNALLPVINVVALTIAWLLGGVVVIESVFNYPGLGRMMIDSISDRDLPVTQAIALIIASVYVAVNLTADILTMMANPRLRTLHTRRR
ncbi:MAG: ABC transporter permease [Rhodobacter sp. BACL10 MAG-120910-bin24]|mgnify:CR=1 FL=1|jgi:peptide/nickel transport system permease protein|nr:MAG: ABC transporter permease [Rhodobacter sp. BACL10 MAG-120910-bin24]KRP25046.1 MAG: ABC transporter permease [Rhodobacter sp. BACL10 MAG-120419-bin15]